MPASKPMRFAALATDYDGTIADQGFVDQQTIDSLRRLRASGRRVILVTGRTIVSMREAFPCLTEFDSIVAENGATLYNPLADSETLLTDPPSEPLVNLLRQRATQPFDVGVSIVATSTDQKEIVLEAIHELALELQIIFNKGSLMILPSGVNKATGLTAAAKAMGLSLHNIAGVGDAENDHAFLSACEFSVAVANALPTVKERVHWVTPEGHGRGVAQLIDAMIGNDLADYPARMGRPLLIGHTADKKDVTVPACAVTLVAGHSGGGKSTFTTSFLESVFGAGYQFCVIDAEGDYELFPDALLLGNSTHVPSLLEIDKALSRPTQNVVVNLLGVDLAERPRFFESVFTRVQELRTKVGRPHCLIVDEAHHFVGGEYGPDISPLEFSADDPAAGLLLITVNPERLPAKLLSQTRFVAIAGESPEPALRAFCETAGCDFPKIGEVKLEQGQMLGWCPGQGDPFVFSIIPSDSERVRHRRKYAEGELAPDRSFYFRGQEGKLNLRAQNLITFLSLMEGVDEDTWLHHLRAGDYSAWFRREIKDDDMAGQAAQIENDSTLSVEESREKMHALIAERYTIPA